MDNPIQEEGIAEIGQTIQNTKLPGVFEINPNLSIPKYLDETYWWAYLHPRGVNFFDKTLIVDSILFGNYRKLRDAVITEITHTPGDVLQLACVYGNISLRIADSIQPNHHLDVVDIAPVQLQNLSKKISTQKNIYLHHQDASDLNLNHKQYEHVISFFLLHEVPDELKTKILQQAIDHTRDGGKLTIVDYHKPRGYAPQRYLMYPVLHFLEPFALSMWHNDIRKWLPDSHRIQSLNKTTFFGGLYQKVDIQL